MYVLEPVEGANRASWQIRSHGDEVVLKEGFSIVVEGVKAGYICWKWEEKALFLCNFILEEKFQGQGLGSSILKDVIVMAEKQGKFVQLKTFVGHPVRRLYERHGFRVMVDDGINLTMARELGG